MLHRLSNQYSSLDPYYESSTHRWHENNNLQFETCSSTGCPETLSLRLSSISFESKGGENIALSDESGTNYYSSEVGFSFLNLSELWKKGSSSNLTTEVNIFDYNAQPDVDQQGLLIEDMKICQQVSESFSFISFILLKDKATNELCLEIDHRVANFNRNRLAY